MKLKISVVILFVFTLYFGANAQVSFIENFNYPAGDSIGAYGWVWNTGTTNTIKVVSPGLTYAGYPQSGIGNACRLRNNGYDAYKDFTPITSGSVYCSFMLNVDSIQAIGGDYCFAMLPSTSTTNYTCRFYVKDSLGGVMFGINKSSLASNPVVWGSSIYLKNTTYLIIVKYKFLSGTTTDDELSVFVFTSPTLPATEPSTPNIGPMTSTATDAPDLGRVALRQGSATYAPTVTIDGIKVTTSWATVVSVPQTISTVADKFALYQNYPNPFNPTTNIKYQIKNNGFVNLKVFDINGKEISTLVNEKQTAGIYEATFDASDISSGIYFYKLMTGNFSETKKMVIIK